MHLERATRSDPKYRLMALVDPDLEPLWDSLAADWSGPPKKRAQNRMSY